MSSYNALMDRANRSAPRGARRASLPARARAVLLVAAGVLPWPSASAAAGLDALERVVYRACECAARQASGMDAAIRCTHGPREFGRIKVMHHDAWDDAQRARAAALERIIETCIAGAMDADAARTRLGLPRASTDPPRALVRWRQVAAHDLGAHRSRLVRIARVQGGPVKGMVEAVADGAVVLRLARRDGGGAERIPLRAIQGAWVMELPR